MTNEAESDTNREVPTADARRPTAGRLKWLAIGLGALLLVYGLSPYYSFWRFTQALKAGDQQQFEAMVDFRSVRESLKKQLRAKLAESRGDQPKKERNPFGLSDQFGSRLIDTLVDAYVTPAGLAALLADVKEGEDPNALPADPRDPAAIAQSEAVRDKLGFSSVRYAFFTGARDFLLDVDGTKLRFRFSKMRWTLKTVEPDLSDIRL